MATAPAPYIESRPRASQFNSRRSSAAKWKSRRWPTCFLRPHGSDADRRQWRRQDRAPPPKWRPAPAPLFEASGWVDLASLSVRTRRPSHRHHAQLSRRADDPQWKRWCTTCASGRRFSSGQLRAPGRRLRPARRNAARVARGYSSSPRAARLSVPDEQAWLVPPLSMPAGSTADTVPGRGRAAVSRARPRDRAGVRTR